jgi:hypothetical protein
MTCSRSARQRGFATSTLSIVASIAARLSYAPAIASRAGTGRAIGVGGDGATRTSPAKPAGRRGQWQLCGDRSPVQKLHISTFATNRPNNAEKSVRHPLLPDLQHVTLSRLIELSLTCLSIKQPFAADAGTLNSILLRYNSVIFIII